MNGFKSLAGIALSCAFVAACASTGTHTSPGITPSGSTGSSLAAPWLVLPPIPELPKPDHSGYASVNGIKLRYAEYGHGAPVILIPGGFGFAAWWGNQIPALAKHYRVIAIDSRGQGRSSHDPDAKITYRLMASDVLGLMDHLHIRKTALVGWSDGSIIGLELAIHHPERLTKLFAFGANTDPSGYHNSRERSEAQNAVVDDYSRLMRSGFLKLSPTPRDFEAFHRKMSNLWNTSPHISAAQLQAIRVPTWIVDGDHDEIIKRKNIDYQFSQIPDARELIIPGASHFAFLQQPQTMNAALLDFMAWQPARTASR
ncbi:MAG: alpha/beta fold hydrolase [Rhodanobacteraceae bacterium]